VLLHVSNLIHFGYLLLVWSVVVVYVTRTAANRFRTTLRLLQIIPFLFALDLIVGISAGPVITNLSHGKELMFQIWGEAVIEAEFARDEAELGQIVVNTAIQQALADKYPFKRMPGERAVALWVLAEGE